MSISNLKGAAKKKMAQKMINASIAIGTRNEPHHLEKLKKDREGYNVGHIKGPSGKLFKITKPTVSNYDSQGYHKVTGEHRWGGSTRKQDASRRGLSYEKEKGYQK